MEINAYVVRVLTGLQYKHYILRICNLNIQAYKKKVSLINCLH